jgi:hypothetical protein
MNTLHSPFFSLYIMIFRIFAIFSSKNYTIKEKIINFAHIKLEVCSALCRQSLFYVRNNFMHDAHKKNEFQYFIK